MVASIGAIASASQGVSYYEKDGYYAKDDQAHKQASAWQGRGAEAMGLSGAVEPEAFQKVLEGHVPGGRQLGKKQRDGTVHHRPGVDVTLSAPKSVSLAALVGGDRRIVKVHDKAVNRTLNWIENKAIETRMADPATGAMIRKGNQKMVAATFTHDTSRNLDPQLHTHAVIANTVQSDNEKWRTMVNDGVYRGVMAIGAIYRAELARGLEGLGYGIEKTHSDGRFEIEGVSREVIEAFSTRRAEIVEAMEERGLGEPGDNARLADRAALMTRAHKRDVDKSRLQRDWSRQASELDFPAKRLVSNAKRQAARTHSSRSQGDLFSTPDFTAAQSARWAVDHLSERQSVFTHNDLLTGVLVRDPGAVTVEAAEQAIADLAKGGTLHRAGIGLPRASGHAVGWTTDAALARESETIALMRAGQKKAPRMMRRWVAETRLHRGRLNEGQKEAVKIILASKDRVVGVQGYAGTGKTTMLKRFRSLAEYRGYNVKGLAPSASAARTLGQESGIRSETLQRFLARQTGLIEGRVSGKALKRVRKRMDSTVLVVDEASLASTEQMKNLLKVATDLRLPRVVLVGDEKQLDGVDAGKPFSQLRKAGMATAVMDDILRQKNSELKKAVVSTLSGEVRKAFETLGRHVHEAEPGQLGHDAAQRWLGLAGSERENAGIIAPTRSLRDGINRTIRKSLVAEGEIRGPARRGEKLVSLGFTGAEAAVASNYTAGDTVIFNRRYKTLGVEKGDEREVAHVDHRRHTVHLKARKGRIVKWQPWRVAAGKAAGKYAGCEVYRSHGLELRAGDRVRVTRNDKRTGLVNGQMARVAGIEEDAVRFELEDGDTITLGEGDPQLRFLDHAWASTIHAFQGRTVDTIIAAMEARNPSLVNQKSLYVAISRARYRAELITDNAGELADHLERASGERVSALDAAAQAATVKGIVRELHDPSHGGAPDKAIERYWHGPAGQELDSGAQTEKKPDRQIAEWGAEFETVERPMPGTGRGAAPGPAPEQGAGDSPERKAELDKEREPIEIEMDR